MMGRAAAAGERRDDARQQPQRGAVASTANAAAKRGSPESSAGATCPRDAAEVSQQLGGSDLPARRGGGGTAARRERPARETRRRYRSSSARAIARETRRRYRSSSARAICPRDAAEVEQGIGGSFSELGAVGRHPRAAMAGGGSRGAALPRGRGAAVPDESSTGARRSGRGGWG